MSDCSQYCDAQTFKTDGSAAGGATVASQDTSNQVLCTQCTSQCGSSESVEPSVTESSETQPSSVETSTEPTSGGGRRRKRKTRSKKRKTRKGRKTRSKKRKLTRKYKRKH